MASTVIPQEVLADALGEKIADRRVRAAVFTTYSFDPGFFELHILPLLFNKPFHQAEKIRRVQLDDALRSTQHIAVYYDRTALSQGALPALSGFRRIDVRRLTGVFHPKLVLVLVDADTDEGNEEDASPRQSLIVGALSANLTRPGWWESVETGHFEEIDDYEIDDERCSFRKDLMSALLLVQNSADPGEDHSALESIRDFLRTRTNREPVQNHSARGRHYTRLFVGQASLPDWFAELRLDRGDWNLEIISPYFDAGDSGTLRSLLEVLQPRETRVYLPRRPDGGAEVTTRLYEGIAELARWSTLPYGVLQPGARGDQKSVPPRRVHAKVYRLWLKGHQDLVLTGSVNLTAPAHSHRAAGNLEAAFLVDITDNNHPKRWWLEPLQKDPAEYAERDRDEIEGAEEVFIDVRLQFDWRDHTLSYRIDDSAPRPFDIRDTSGIPVASVSQAKTGRWIPLPDEAGAKVAGILRSTSFLTLHCGDASWRVLIREENIAHRPSLLFTLTPEEILRYWSLLTEAQKEAFLEARLARQADIQGLPVVRTPPLDGDDTVFGRFSGLFHAFDGLKRHIHRAIAEREWAAAEASLLGQKYDSVPVLLDRIVERDDDDPVMRYVTFLCAQQLREDIAKTHRKFWRSVKPSVGALDERLQLLPQIRESVPLDDRRDEFFDWYEEQFMMAPALGDA